MSDQFKTTLFTGVLGDRMIEDMRRRDFVQTMSRSSPRF